MEIVFDLTKTFWQMNPGLKGVGRIGEIRDKDRSHHSVESSKLMWYLAGLTSIRSPYYGMTRSERLEMLSNDLGISPKLENYTDVILLIEKIEDTPAARQLRLWNKIMDDKTEYMDSLNYRENSAKLEELMLSNRKLFEDYKKCVQMLKEEDEDAKTHGGFEKSLLEEGFLHGQ